MDQCPSLPADSSGPGPCPGHCDAGNTTTASSGPPPKGRPLTQKRRQKQNQHPRPQDRRHTGDTAQTQGAGGAVGHTSPDVPLRHCCLTQVSHWGSPRYSGLNDSAHIAVPTAGMEWDPNPASWASVAESSGCTSRHSLPGPREERRCWPAGVWHHRDSSTPPHPAGRQRPSESQALEQGDCTGDTRAAALMMTPHGTGLPESRPWCWSLSTKRLPSGEAGQDRRRAALDKESRELASCPLCLRAIWWHAAGHPLATSKAHGRVWMVFASDLECVRSGFRRPSLQRTGQ